MLRTIRLLWFGLLALGAWFPDLDLLANAVVVEFMATSTNDLHAAVSIRAVATLTGERADASRFALHGVKGIRVGGLHLQLRACMLVEEINRPL